MRLSRVFRQISTINFKQNTPERLLAIQTLNLSRALFRLS